MISPILLLILKFVYAICLFILFLFSMNSLTLGILYLVHRKRIWSQHTPEMKQEWPKVTIQLPVFNEQYMVERLIKAIVRLDYPSDKLQIQVLDDSTDTTTALLAELISRFQRRGINIHLLHREDRSGFKAGAMEQALKLATGDFVAVFDADFLPRPDWLKKTIPWFQNPKIGFVQTRWGHVNNHYNVITRLAAMALDAHFVVEQTARAGANLLMSFNGTAGVWRIAAIESVGGWQSDTLTEDLDLSFRAQMAGWKYVYLPEVVVRAEVPAQIDALKKQQVRWVKGNFQVSKKLLGKVLTSRLNAGQKIMAFMHLNMLFLPYPVTFLTMLLTFPINLYAPHFMYLFGYTLIGSWGPVFLYTIAKSEFNPSLFKRVLLLPGLMLLGIGISLNCTIGIIGGFSKKSGTFERTPKFNLSSSKVHLSNNHYAVSISPVAAAEMLMGAYMLFSTLYLYIARNYSFPYWQLVPTFAYFMIAGSSMLRFFRRTYEKAHLPEPESQAEAANEPQTSVATTRYI